MAALDPFRDRPFMDLGRPVVDAEGADFPENLFDDAVARYPGTAHHLNAAVGDAHQRLGHGDLGDRTLLEAERSAVERVGAPVNHQFRLPQIDEILGEHEADPRSEEHTSELQSLMRISYAVFCLKKQK